MSRSVACTGLCAAHLVCLVLGLMVGGAGCFTGGGPPLPDLSTPHNQITQRTERLRRIEKLVQRDLTRFETLRLEFFEDRQDLFARPFPLDLYKHVAVDCLNEPWDPNQIEVSESGVDRSAAALSCSPEFIERLVVALERQAPERRQQALNKLHIIDALRQLRGQLRSRLSRIEPIASASRNLLAARRADLRQMRLSYERRRTEYSVERWAQLQQSLDEHEETLQELQAQIDSLVQTWPQWPEALDHSVSMLYMDLSKLTHRGALH